MEVIKRTGLECDFDKSKITTAILKAMNDVGEVNNSVANRIANDISKLDKDVISVEEIQDLVEEKLWMSKLKNVARAYTRYRYKRELLRQENTTDKNIFELLEGKSEYWNKENSNKNARVVTTQRDYIAGITSTDITRRFLLPKDILEAHDQGIIHFHDADYFAQNVLHNCELINLEDMLQNGTVINNVMIEKPHRFITAATIATQIITAVTSSSYGGATISLTALAPFVKLSYENYFKKYKDRGLNNDVCDKFAKEDVKIEIRDGVQTFVYQCNSMTNTNGQSPFLSVCMYLGETDEFKNELAMIIEEFLNQRIAGMKNEKGVYITPSFPKLLYVLEEDNIHENSKYWYLTKLAAKCSAKRLVPDYISEKVMKENKIDKNGNGNCYPCMGCVEGQEIITYIFYNFLFVESFERMWERLSSQFEIKKQPNGCDEYMDLNNVMIYDKDKGFVKTKRIIKNMSSEWLKVKMTNGRVLTCTYDHPFVTNRGRILAKDLLVNDVIPFNFNQYSESLKSVNSDLAWAYGVLLCDSSYSSNVVASFALNGEDDIINNLANIISNEYDIKYKIQEQHRDKKGNYKDLKFYKSDKLKYKLISMFEGIAKNNRHIPNEVFTWNYEAKCSFLAGMIDADGYVNSTKKVAKIQLGSTNKELALQQAALAQSLNMRAYIYENHYNSKDYSKIRYRVEFVPSLDLINSLKCKKKIDNYKTNIKTYSNSTNNDYGLVKELEVLNLKQYSFDVTTESDHFDVSGIHTHNCRSFLTPYIDENGKAKYYGRFNQGVVTINLVDIALSSNKDMDEFWKIFDERTELCHRALQIRHERLSHGTSDVAPILWQHGALARLDKGESIHDLLHNGYSTISLGYVGLYECVKYMTGKSHTDNGEGYDFAVKVMQGLNNKCNQWKEEENIDYSIYGTPCESSIYKFAKCLKKRFGIIEGITDHDYITNSYHVNVREKIDPFSKLELEAQFQKLSPGGCISYIECSDLTGNTEAVLEVIKFIYENIMYAELNTKSDYCQNCGYDGELLIDENMEWYCPNCGNRDQNKMNVARRTCGYIGSHFWNYGRTEEIKERYVHLGGDE